jgi:hypothetical protein
MLYRLARLLQLIGMILVPLALAGNLAEAAGMPHSLGIKDMLLLALLGILVFYIGWSLQQRVKG